MGELGQNGFPGRKITYHSNSNDHDFHIEYNDLTHCLCISKETINGSDTEINSRILDVLYHIVDIFRIAESPVRLLLTNDGIKEVAEGHCKQTH